MSTVGVIVILLVIAFILIFIIASSTEAWAVDAYYVEIGLILVVLVIYITIVFAYDNLNTKFESLVIENYDKNVTTNAKYKYIIDKELIKRYKIKLKN